MADKEVMARYYEAGAKSLSETGVHHLSKSSVEALLECTNKFLLKSSYRTAKPLLSLGSVGHSLQETLVEKMSVGAQTYLRGEISLDTFRKVYPEFRDAVLASVDLPDMIMNLAEEEYNEAVGGPVEVLFPEGPLAFRNELMRLSETLGKSLTVDHCRELLDQPVLWAELPVVYVPEGRIIPYSGYVDMVKLSQTGLRISDLKMTFSNNAYVWNSLMTQFQLWLYAVSMLQMKLTDTLPEVDITRVVVDIGAKRKIKPTRFDVKIERRVLPGLTPDSPRFYSIIEAAERMVTGGVEVYAHSMFGCPSCDLLTVCDKCFVPNWKIELGGEDDQSEKSV